MYHYFSDSNCSSSTASENVKCNTKRIAIEPNLKVQEGSNQVSTIDEIKESSKPELNAKKTEAATNVFRTYLRFSDQPTNFEEFNKEKLKNTLMRFYVEARREDGKPYKPSYMHSVRYSLTRYLDFTRGINIMTDPFFKEANQVFETNLEKLKKTYVIPVEEKDVVKLYRSGIFDVGNPVGLQNKVWFELMGYVCRTSRGQSVRLLTRQDFAINTDADGRRYVYQIQEQQPNNVGRTARTKSGRMYETKDIGCPVASFEHYLSRLSSDDNALFQTPLTGDPFIGTCWYSGNPPLGIRKLYKFMCKLSEEAGLSRCYNNRNLTCTPPIVLDHCRLLASKAGLMSPTQNVGNLVSYVVVKSSKEEEEPNDGMTLTSAVDGQFGGAKNGDSAVFQPLSVSDVVSKMRRIAPAPVKDNSRDER